MTLLNIANYPTTYSPLLFSRGVDDGPMYIDIGSFEYAGSNGAENNYWTSFPVSGNLTFICTGVNSYYNNPKRTYNGEVYFTNNNLI